MQYVRRPLSRWFGLVWGFEPLLQGEAECEDSKNLVCARFGSHGNEVVTLGKWSERPLEGAHQIVDRMCCEAGCGALADAMRMCFKVAGP